MRRKFRIISPVEVVDIADRGNAIGKDEEGIVYLLNNAVPGDVVTISYGSKKKGMRLGRIEKIDSFSDKRVDPVCKHFGICGGCKWQHMNYKSQLFYKEKNVRDAFRRIAHLNPEVVDPIRAAADIYYYRNKLEYTFSNSRWLTNEDIKSQKVFKHSNALGFHRPGSFHKIVQVENCHLQVELGDQIRNFVDDKAYEMGLSYYDYKVQSGFLRNLIIRNTTLDEWMVIMVFGKKNKPAIDEMMKAIAMQFPQITSLQYVVNTKLNDTILDQDVVLYQGAAEIKEQLGKVIFNIGPKSFFQTNSKQAIQLFEIIKELADLQGDEIIYDLYTGLGSIALYLAENCHKIIGIEEVPEAIDDAKRNAVNNDIQNASFHVGDVKLILNQDFLSAHGRPDLIITDPPRMGMHPIVVETLLTSNAPKIVYVSCNPSTQARDLILLKEKYNIVKAIPVDMFPHTHHIENVALLELRDNKNE